MSERLQCYSDRLLLVDYLISELMAARILQEKKPENKIELKLVSLLFFFNKEQYFYFFKYDLMCSCIFGLFFN